LLITTTLLSVKKHIFEFNHIEKNEKVNEKVFVKIECVQNKQKYKINIVKNSIFTKLDKGYIMCMQT